MALSQEEFAKIELRIVLNNQAPLSESMTSALASGPEDDTFLNNFL